MKQFRFSLGGSISPRKRRAIAISASFVVAAILGIAFLVALLGPLADAATPVDKDRASAINSTRQTLLGTAAGLAALTGLLFTARTFSLTRRGQITDRYTKAIGQLASEKLTERLGGIYALEHLMRESGRDHESIVEVLAAFIRITAPFNPDADNSSNPRLTLEHSEGKAWHGRSAPRITHDVQAALHVLGRRPEASEANPLDLRHTDLRGADLANARLDRALLNGSCLRDADLLNARLNEANLGFVQLQNARLSRAKLRKVHAFGMEADGAILNSADLKAANLIMAKLRKAELRDVNLASASLMRAELSEANLARADLSNANLMGAELDGAIFKGAILNGASLRGHLHLEGGEIIRSQATGLTREQLASATFSEETVIPLYLLKGQSSDNDRCPHE
ncbi:pentapeptide repeat-containing protein [Micromonospora sp. NPDC005710]|uniref:pentapeptide repeat-containing protein n=1 Tax=Micromonospora sp. NPDC005710 TaxID=3157051 RepID=UPI0033F49200